MLPLLLLCAKSRQFDDLRVIDDQVTVQSLSSEEILWAYWNDDYSSYVVPQNWSSLGYSRCSSSHTSQQSPINIISADVVQGAVTPSLDGQWALLRNATLVNSGYNAGVIPAQQWQQGAIGQHNLDIGAIGQHNFPENSGGTIFDLHSFHFHWGETEAEGSEHSIDGQHYPLELHIIHTQQGNPAPLQNAGGLAVVSTFFRLGTKNEQLERIFTQLDEVADWHSPASRTILTADINVEGLLPMDWRSNFWSYRGGLTTPSCDEVVNWLVMRRVQEVSPAQLSKLRKLRRMDGQLQRKNYRPVQPLNGRRVHSGLPTTILGLHAPVKTRTSGIRMAATATQGSGDQKKEQHHRKNRKLRGIQDKQ